MSKQDRQGARTVPDLERRYNFGKAFSEILGIANDARDAAEKAQEAAENANSAVGDLTADELFNRLTDNGKSQGIYRENGEIYINASFIKTGFISSDLIKAGVIRSADFEVRDAVKIYPGSNVFPSATLFPNNGEEITRGIEIDFANGIIRGVFFYDVTNALAERIRKLENAVFG